tara:strand:+ start:3290 stop:3559 length:270 start_codon:yes stop_codon:yes gene_type:complete
MKHLGKWNLVWLTGVVGILLNVVLSLVLTPFATREQIKPPNGAASLDPFGQFMHMIVHHKQVLFMSSLIVFIVVTLSTTISLALPIVKM